MDAETKTLVREAACWLARRDAGFSPTQQSEFGLWLESDERHARIFSEVERTWIRLDRVRGTRVTAGLEMELDELPEVTAGGCARPGGRPAWLAARLAAAAAAVALGYFGWVRMAAGAGEFSEAATTPIGAVRTLNLPDGSIIHLNTETTLRVQFTRATRSIFLDQGEGLFTVAKDPVRPFVVNAGGVAVRAIGTAFNVRLRSTDVEVIVTKGKVRVDGAVQGVALVARHRSAPATSGAESELLSVGEGVVVPVIGASSAAPAPVAPVLVSPTEMERVLAWPERRLVFVSTPLVEMVAEFNRYNHRKLEIIDGDLARRRFGGTFQANDPETFVQLLGKSFGVVAEERDGRTLLATARP